jgi:hypothetical protein
MGAVCLLHYGAHLLLHFAIRVRGSQDASNAVLRGTCLRWVTGGDVRALAWLERVWHVRAYLKRLACFTITVAYVYIVNVLLRVFDCFTTPDGRRVMRADPAAVCASAAHRRLQAAAIAIIVAVGPGVPLSFALWVWHLRRRAVVNKRASSAVQQRRAWRGLADASTRADWGALYESFKFTTPPRDERIASLAQLRPAPGSTGDTALGRLRWRLEVARYAMCFRLAPVYTAVFSLQKLLLVLAVRLVDAPRSQAGAQLAVYMAFSALLA